MARPLSRNSRRKTPAAIQKKRIIFLVGPTAAGKTEIAAGLAGKINAEIISCDSMQVYQKMNIVTQKPSLTLRKKVRHHLMGIIPPGREYSAAEYQRQAYSLVQTMTKKGKVPLFAGGTGFYMSIMLDGIFREDRAGGAIRQRLCRQAQRYGSRRLYARLAGVDPQAASKIHPNDLRRVVRALEVYEKTGTPITELQRQRKGVLGGYDVKIFCINRDRQELYGRIDRRVDAMFRQGLVREVRGLLKAGLSRTACQAIGVKEIKGFCDGLYDLEEARRLVKRNSRRYAKRQLSWFRRDKRISWINIRRNEPVKETVKRIRGKLGL